MKCLRPVLQCGFRKKENCTYVEGQCSKVIDKCVGCDRITNEYCSAYANPSKKWENCNCPMATNIVKKETSAKKVNPLKASKKARK